MKTLNFRIVGTSPLVCHNGQLADRSNTYSRRMAEITSKRKKTDADYEELAKIEWFGGLYLFNQQPCIPGYVFEAALIGRSGSARKEKMGKEAAASVFVTKDFPLIYDGPKDPRELWEDERFRFQRLVKVQANKVMRTRPIFLEWAADIEVEFNPDLIDEEVLRRWVEIAGEQVGLMDWRPKFGRFSVEWPD